MTELSRERMGVLIKSYQCTMNQREFHARLAGSYNNNNNNNNKRVNPCSDMRGDNIEENIYPSARPEARGTANVDGGVSLVRRAELL